MENYKEIIISVISVIILSLLFDLSNLPPSQGKVFAYLGIGFLPVLIIQFNKINKEPKDKISTGMFVFSLILNTFMVLSFAAVILIIVFGKF